MKQLLLMFCMTKNEKIFPGYVSKHNSNREKQVILLMIPNKEKGHYLAINIISSKHYGNFYCLNCSHSFRTKNKLESHKIVCENKNFCDTIMRSEDTKILEFNQYQKSDKVPFLIYTDLECIIEKIDGCETYSIRLFNVYNIFIQKHRK